MRYSSTLLVSFDEYLPFGVIRIQTPRDEIDGTDLLTNWFCS